MIKLPQLEGVVFPKSSYKEMTLRKFGNNECYLGKVKADILFNVVERNIVRKHYYGDFDYYQKINDDTLEYVESNVFFISFVTVTFYIAYLIGRHLVTDQNHGIGHVLKQGFISIFAAAGPVLYLFGTLVIIGCVGEMGENILPRSRKALNAVNEEKNRSHLNSRPNWSIFFEIHFQRPLEIAGDRAFKNLICYFGMIQDFLRQSIIIPLLDFFDPLFHRESNDLTTPEDEEGNPLLPTSLPFDYGSIGET